MTPRSAESPWRSAGSSSTARCRDPVILEDRAFGNDAGVEIAPEINDQPPRDRDNPDLSGYWPRVGEAGRVPCGQRALPLIRQPAPRNLRGHGTDALITRLTDPLFMMEKAAPIWCPDQPGDAADFATITEPAPGEEFRHEHPCALLANAAQLQQLPDQHHRCIGPVAQFSPPRAFEGVNVRREQGDFLPLVGDAGPQRR
jgi:hypothetical protein